MERIKKTGATRLILTDALWRVRQDRETRPEGECEARSCTTTEATPKLVGGKRNTTKK